MGRKAVVASGISLLVAGSGWVLSRAQTGAAAAPAECSYFGAPREEAAAPKSGRLSRVTEAVVRTLGIRPRAAAPDAAYTPGSIDAYLFADMQANGVTPARKTTDWEFIRRVTLDLTGRIPTPGRVLAFVADPAPDKRARLVDELLARPEWVDKWTMYFGDLYKNTADRPSTGLRRFPQGRNAFYQWIRDSLAAGKPYDRMAAELITAEGDSSWGTGTLNWMLNGYVGGGPAQDITDQQAANVAETFLGISHLNCLLCHNGRGHLDALSLWGRNTTRYQAWQMAAFLSHTTMARHVPDPSSTNIYYWSVLDTVPRDYPLGTTTGNRPARLATLDCTPGKPCYVAPAYLLTGEHPAAGESYRAALARLVTGDFQFARASVNYLWAQFFGRGIVDPPNQFDPARLDPANPPPAPWTLQPSNARLLDALAQGFIDNHYNLQALMREIVNSGAYQLASSYDGAWNPDWERLFARKFVRRLWAEEIHDALVDSSGVPVEYKVTGFSGQGFPVVDHAMQLPDTVNVPGGAVNTFLDSFLRGNRDDADRKPEGSVLQALNLMNDPFVMARTAASGAAPNRLIAANLSNSDADLVNALFLGILSRYPSADEMAAARAALTAGNRTQGARNLAWALYNKVDFVFNY